MYDLLASYLLDRIPRQYIYSTWGDAGKKWQDRQLTSSNYVPRFNSKYIDAENDSDTLKPIAYFGNLTYNGSSLTLPVAGQ